MKLNIFNVLLEGVDVISGEVLVDCGKEAKI
jgi:hypothetical protein